MEISKPIRSSVGVLGKYFGNNPENICKADVLEIIREDIGQTIDIRFCKFLDWLQSSGYSFGSLDDGPPVFNEKRVYLRYDIHVQDLLTAYILADIHEQRRIPGSFQITWKFSNNEELAEKYFLKLTEFDSKYIQFGLHCAPVATWFINDKFGGDYKMAREYVETNEFTDYLEKLFKEYTYKGDQADEICSIISGSEKSLNSIAIDFKNKFGDWSTISGHGNYLTRGFTIACSKKPDLEILKPYFHPVQQLTMVDLNKYGFSLEVTSFGFDKIPGPRVMLESNPEDKLRQWYHERVSQGGGFIALFHPATWSTNKFDRLTLPLQ